MPATATLSLPGWALARAISSATLLALNDGRATRIAGELAIWLMGVKSLTGSKGRLS